MQCNYIGPNLMNQVNVPPAPLTLVACGRPSLFGGHAEAFTLRTVQSHSGRKKEKKKPSTCTSHCSQS